MSDDLPNTDKDRRDALFDLVDWLAEVLVHEALTEEADRLPESES